MEPRIGIDNVQYMVISQEEYDAWVARCVAYANSVTGEAIKPKESN